jgi:hypothetical protein
MNLDILSNTIFSSFKGIILTGVSGAGKTEFLQKYFPQKVRKGYDYFFIDGLSGVEDGWKYDYYPKNLIEKMSLQLKNCYSKDLSGILKILSSKSRTYLCIDEGAFVFTDNIWDEPNINCAKYFLDFSKKVKKFESIMPVVVFHKKSLSLFCSELPEIFSYYSVQSLD